MKKSLFTILANFIAVFLLVFLISAPIYFARNFAKVAGVKSESKYLIISQVEKFPNLSFSQSNDHYTIFFDKIGESQAFLEVLVLNNPTSQIQNYKIVTTQGNSKVFFGDSLSSQLVKINLPGNSSVPISLYSASNSDQQIEFKITANNE